MRYVNHKLSLINYQTKVNKEGISEFFISALFEETKHMGGVQV